MTYVPGVKDDPGDVGHAAYQQQSIDNENALWAALMGPAPASRPPGIIAQWVSKVAIADNVATEICTITTANEAGNVDGGVYGVEIQGIACHGVGPADEASAMHLRVQFARAINGAGAAGNASAVVSSSTTAIAASTVATKTITTAVITVTETSEYVLSVKITIDCAGTTVTTGQFHGMVTLTYAGFTTPPVIA